MKKKWIIPAIIAVVLVAIALFIAAYPILLFVAATDESIKQLNNSYINSDYQGWHEVTFFDKHHFSLPDTWRIEAIDDTTYCIYAEDAQVIAYVGKLGRYAGMDSFWNSRSPYAVGIICRGTFRQWLLYVLDDGHDARYTSGRIRLCYCRCYRCS